MESPEPDRHTAADLPAAVYAQIREQTQSGASGRNAGLLASAVFVLASLLLVILIETGTDIQQVLLAAVAIAAVNLVIGVVWVTAAQRPR